MGLAELPVVERLTLAQVTRVPEAHPEHARFRPFPVHAWIVRHPDGPILIDTGIGEGHDGIESWYGPEIVPLARALATIDLGVDDIVAVVLSHLHFDHCGQQRLLEAPVFVQAAEHEVALSAGYTVDEWAAIPADRRRFVHGDEQIVEGVRLLATPGHTPGHQSVVVEGGDRRVVLGAQCAFTSAELRTGEPATTNAHDATWQPAARASLARLRSLAPCTIHLSHDPDITNSAR